VDSRPIGKGDRSFSSIKL